MNARDYSPEQIEAWAPEIPDEGFWRRGFAHYQVFVAESGETIVGFTEFERTGHIDCFHVHHGGQRRGVGTRLLERTEQMARTHELAKIFAEVSIRTRPFFEQMGFAEKGTREKWYRGQRFLQYLMEKQLVGGQVYCVAVAT